MYKLLIADGSDAYICGLTEIFQEEFDLRTCQDGETALELLQSFQPDVLVISLMLPYKDGLTVLQESAFRPRVILAITPFVNQYIKDVTLELGVQFIMIMPRISALRVRLMDLIATTIAPKEDLSVQTAVLLHSLSFSPHLDGYQQLCVGIPLYAQNPDMRITKELYPQIAKEFDLPDPRTVEHSIRKAITAAWARMNPVTWAKYFPMDEKGEIPCPTNKEFVARLAEFIEL